MYTYPHPQNLAYPARVLSDEGALSRSDSEIGQSASWPARGALERSTALWLVERREALRLALGAHGALPCEVGTLIPPPGVPRKHPGASRRSIPSRRSREGNGNLGRIAPREQGSLLFETV